MKKYFTKYLTFEGEIKAGDSIYLKDSKTIATMLVDMPDYISCYNVKLLFLCSKDIQVGDKVRNPVTLAEFEIGEGGEDNGFVSLPYANVTHHFKVIGEISSEADWVKEGDEFDEEDIKLWVHCMTSWGEIRRSYSSIYSDLKNSRVVVEIKCPTCNRFH